MANNKILYIVVTVLVLVVLGVGAFLFLTSQSPQTKNTSEQQLLSPTLTTISDDKTIVDCTGKDPGCFFNRLSGCLPVTGKMTGTDNSIIEITILGVENEKCHFQRKINNTLNLDCYFVKGTLNGDTFDQMFGNDKGLQKVVDDACKIPGW